MARALWGCIVDADVIRLIEWGLLWWIAAVVTTGFFAGGK